MDQTQRPVLLNNLAIFRWDASRDLDSSNLCPVVPPPPLAPPISPPPKTLKGGKAACSLARGQSWPSWAIGATTNESAVQDSRTITGKVPLNARAWVAALACLNEACSEVVVGGSFNSLVGTTAFSVARLVFDDGFYTARRYES